MTYRKYISALLQTPEVRALGGTFLYGTSYDLFNEYLSEKSTSAICVRRLDGNFEDQSEAEFYILLDFLTFVPFGLAGREALEGKGICAEEVAYRYALLLLEGAKITLSDAERVSLYRFFSLRRASNLPPDAVGIASATRQIGDALLGAISLQKCAGSLGKARALSLYLRKMADAFRDGASNTLDLTSILDEIPKLSTLSSDAWVEEWIGRFCGFEASN